MRAGTAQQLVEGIEECLGDGRRDGGGGSARTASRAIRKLSGEEKGKGAWEAT